ncbi:MULTISPECIES: NAD(P)/FAD-dependent oxidoreductase [unclassified Corallococcus]|uniref:NAD(P)/FAD-dependent oxidoreductase n=1 Tax=unclassified Corallococcus TaxID=2685029 RepID=UPI001CBFEE8F|nr:MULTISPECIES: NAD(P)/FAD-dependent oxidoreductase [unclassified Corallococcus]MBZ4330433.1 FAD-dependent oxidoreductase [Corallococcus sp. AS-1-12]MBZ4377091.1 FAD-dependent oxidoreductase [Corallococcus sp. AS-1-6]
MAKRPGVIVVGGGLAGLACATALLEARVDAHVLEAGDAPGGRVRTDSHEGFLLDRGFQVYLTAYPEGRRVLDLKALSLQRFIPGAKVWRGGRLHTLADPLRRPVTAASHLLDAPGGLADKLRVLELRQHATSGELEDLWQRPQQESRRFLRDLGFSEEMLEAFFTPFLGGIFLERGLTTSSRMLEFVFRMFATGYAAVPAQGMGAIPAQLAAKLPSGALRMRVRVEEAWGHRVLLPGGEMLHADAVVVATDPSSAASLLVGMPAPRMNRVTCLYFAAPEPPVEGPWLVLDGEGRGPVNNVAVMSEVSAAYAPPGQALVSVSVVDDAGGADSLEARVRAQLTEWFGAAVSAWRHLRTYTLAEALPAQPPSALVEPHRPVRLAAGLYVCGDHRENASIDGALASGRRAAEAVLQDLGR